MSLFTNAESHTVIYWHWVEEQDRKFIEKLEKKFDCLEDAMAHVLEKEFEYDAKIFNWLGHLVHEHRHGGHGETYCS